MSLLVMFDIDGPSIPWKSPQVVQRGKFKMAYSPKKMTERKKYIAMIAKMAMGEMNPTDLAVHLEVTIYKKIPKSYSKKKTALCQKKAWNCIGTPDVTNVIKLTEDALKGIVYDDDKQVVSQSSKRFWSDFDHCNVRVSLLA